MSATTLNRSVEKLIEPGRRLCLRNLTRPTLSRHHFQCHHHYSSVAFVSRGPLTRSWVAPELPVSRGSKYLVLPGCTRTNCQSSTHRRSASSTTMVDSVPLEQVQALLPPSLLEELSTLWFQHIVNEQDLVVPSQDTMMQWFRKDEAFDQLCS